MSNEFEELEAEVASEEVEEVEEVEETEDESIEDTVPADEEEAPADDESPSEGDDLSTLVHSLGADILKTREAEIDTEAEEKARQAAEEAYKSKFKLTTEDFSTELDSIELPEGTININGEDVNLRDIEKEAPGAVALTKALAVSISKKIIDHELNGVREGLQRERFFNELSVYHPDARAIAGDEDFQAWRSVQPPEILALLHSDDILNVALALDLYKKPIEEEAPKEREEPKKVSTKKRLYKTSKSASTAKKSGGYAPNDDSEEAIDSFWNEEI